MDNQSDHQVEYWNRVGPWKSFTHSLDIDRFSQFVKKDGKILDFGCGYGRLCGALRQGGFRNVLGVDSSPRMIERARNLFPDIAFELVNGPQLPFSDVAFDAVILVAVLTCIISNQGQQQLMLELSRVLRPGGILYVSDYPLQEDNRNLDRYEQFRKSFENYGTFVAADGATLRHHDLKWVEFLFREFRRHELFFIDVLTMNGHPARIFQYIGEKQS